MKERITKLLGLADQRATAASVKEIPLDRIRANPFQPRRQFDQRDLKELAESIEGYGLLQPILVRPKSNSWYELIAGERRVRAFRLLGREAIPALIRELADEDMGLLALLENLQRQDLSFWEEAEGYARLLNEFNLTQDELAQRLGKSQSTIANKLRLLRLPDSIRHNISREIFSERHARALLRLKSKAKQEQVAEKIVKEGLTVQATEALISTMLNENKPQKKKARFIRVYKDIRLFINSVRRAAAELKEAGLEVDLKEDETDSNWEIKIVIPKQKKDQAKSTYATAGIEPRS